MTFVIGHFSFANSIWKSRPTKHRFRPDILVSDLAMPDEDGYSLISKVRRSEKGKEIPAVALTALVRVEDRTRALSAGFNMFGPKPVEPTELITAIASLTDAVT